MRVSTETVNLYEGVGTAENEKSFTRHTIGGKFPVIVPVRTEVLLQYEIRPLRVVFCHQVGPPLYFGLLCHIKVLVKSRTN